MFHAKVVACGYTFIKSATISSMTEWFMISYNDPFYAELCGKGLNAFKCGAMRKDLGCYVLIK